MCSFPEKILMKSVLQWTRGKGSNHIWWTHDLQRHLWWLQFTLKGSKHRWNHFHYNIKAAAVGLFRQGLKVCFLACKTWWWGKKMTFLLPNASAINKSLALNGKSHVTRRALKLTNLIPFLSWKFIITCTSSEKAFSASENPTGHLIWRTFPPHRAHAHLRCAVPSVGAGGSSWGRAASIRHSPLRPSRERAWLLRASRTHCRRHTEFHGRSHWDWKVNDAGEVIAGVTRKSQQQCSILGVIGSVPPPRVWTRDAGSQQMEAVRSLVFVGAVLLLGVASALDREGGSFQLLFSTFLPTCFRKKKIPILNKTRF